MRSSRVDSTPGLERSTSESFSRAVSKTAPQKESAGIGRWAIQIAKLAVTALILVSTLSVGASSGHSPAGLGSNKVGAIAQEPGQQGGYTVSGKAVFLGKRPRTRAIRMDADPVCAKLHDGRVLADDKLIAEDGGLANVFVYLEQAPEGSFDHEIPTDSVSLTQKGCLYVPRVQGIRVQQKLQVINSDSTLHNVRSLAEVNRPFNVSQPQLGRRTKFFTKPEKPVKFKCDVHSWMTAYVFVMEHPFFATTSTDGSFSIVGLPAGRHTFIAWHEAFGIKRLTVEVGPDTEPVRIEYDD